MIRPNIIRAIALGIGIFSAALLLGVIEGIFMIKATDNLLNTGINLMQITGIAMIWLTFMIFKHRMP